LVGQLTALDALQFETAQWVATLDAATTPKKTAAPPSTLKTKAPAETPAETPVVRTVISEPVALRAAAAPKEALELKLAPAPVRAVTPPGEDSMDNEAFEELFGVDFGAIREGAEVTSSSDED
jgi:hypothetical protein